MQNKKIHQEVVLEKFRVESISNIVTETKGFFSDLEKVFQDQQTLHSEERLVHFEQVHVARGCTGNMFKQCSVRRERETIEKILRH